MQLMTFQTVLFFLHV